MEVLQWIFAVFAIIGAFDRIIGNKLKLGEEFEKGKTTTIATSGCGLCSAVMMADQLIPNCRFELQDALDLSYAVKGNQKKGTDFNIYGPAVAEKLSLGGASGSPVVMSKGATPW